MSRTRRLKKRQDELMDWITRTGLVLGITLLLGSGTATAGDCPTFLPDLRCEREARPTGSVGPMSSPYLFEDPNITTGLQFVGIYHDFPNDSAFQGGEAGVLALQARLAITDRLAFIATKDGFTIFRPEAEVKDIPMETRVALGIDDPSLDEVDILEDKEDFMDISVGFKYALIDHREEDWGYIVTPHVRFEFDVGEHDIFQGQGDGVFILGTSVGYHQDNWHLLGGLLGQVPIDGDEDSSSIMLNAHVDHAFPVDHGWLEYIVPFSELSWMHWTGSGDGSAQVNTALGRVSLSTAQLVLDTGPFEGADIANLGSAGIKGADLVTLAWGLRLALDHGLSLGASYERAVSNRKDIFEQRVTFMASVEF
jgi:hypothetical protein